MALGRERAVRAQAPHNLPHLASAAGGGLEAVADGTAYEVGEKVDGVAIVLQRPVLVKRRWTDLQGLLARGVVPARHGARV